MKTVTFFSTERELQGLTGLTHSELWNEGFNLDDWDWGFVSDVEWEGYYNDKHPLYEFWMLSSMGNYCCGYKHVEFDGKHYYILYHG